MKALISTPQNIGEENVLMAHKVKVRVVPHRNKDGSLSDVKKDYLVVDKTRRGLVTVAVCNSWAAAKKALDEYRVQIFYAHKSKHPNDQAFLNKHGEAKFL